MEKTLQLIKGFEKRNNISIFLELHGDGSGEVLEFWEGDELSEFNSIDQLHGFLKNTQYKLDKYGRCLNPIQNE